MVDSEAGCVELRKGSVVELREDDMNCGYCGCLLPDEYHPNCKQCGGPRKAAREETSKQRPYYFEGAPYYCVPEREDDKWMMPSGVCVEVRDEHIHIDSDGQISISAPKKRHTEEGR